MLGPGESAGWAQVYFAAFEILEARHFRRVPGTFDGSVDWGPGLDDDGLRLFVAEGLRGMTHLVRSASGVSRFELESFFVAPESDSSIWTRSGGRSW